MKILHVTPAFEPAWQLGGCVRSVGQLCRGLVQLGHDVTIFTTDSGKDYRMPVPVNRQVLIDGIKVYYFKTDLLLGFAYSRILKDACRHHIKEFDIVHITSLWWYPEIPAAHEAWKNQVPYVISTTGGLFKYSLAQKRLKKWLYLKLVEKRILSHSSAIRFTTELEREETSHLKLNVASFIVPETIDMIEFDNLPDKSYSRKMFGIEDEHFVILYLGRLHARKGLDILIRALSSVDHIIPNILLVLAGPDDGFESQLRVLVSTHNLESKVLFLGYVSPEKRNEILRAADFLVLTTYPGENFGNVAVEAMMAGRPVMVSDNVGICREIQADGSGLVVPLNENIIADNLVHMAQCPQIIETMGQAAYEASRRRYDVRVVARQMTTAYKDTITGRRSPALSWMDI
jgi:glycosyltransferase involved in cell wall biosynthesis